MVIVGVILLAILIFILLYIRDKKLLETVTKSHRGTKTERQLILKLLKAKFPAQTIFHDLYIKNKFGNYSQIDLVLATKVGIIVFEVKKYSGWIFGNGNHSKWTQVLAYGKEKYYFYNPILQNKKHVEELKAQKTDFQNIPFFSVVVFFGDCEFRDVSFIPTNTYLTKSPRVIAVVKKIIKENDQAKYKSKRDVVSILAAAVENGSNHKISEKHIKNIKDMLGDERIFH
ncbi:NERD domain-containing protein [Flavobacterium sp. AC]|uniref:NERD domain-containing protein n=1 Tax=Flavobacterium azizsancarii TaxID=2961580 RepID=A0ABT4WAA8_9FLAO|nr:nuclease-related domain-containing protein [Flavobacterium azizsancarii]MDA6069510.1 NERD domain-containing protein [Flavobacterium azizsancarii]